MRAVMIGATGAVGTELLNFLMESSEIGSVVSIGRRPVNQTFPQNKLVQIQNDLAKPESYRTSLEGCDLGFVTLGIGQPTKVTKEELYRVDVECVRGFAQQCRAAGVRHLLVLTAILANANSPSYYLKIKGQLEESIAGMGFPRVSFFQPSMIMTEKNRYGVSQGILLKVHPLIDQILVGGLKDFRSIKVSELGQSMALHAVACQQTHIPGKIVVERLRWPHIRELLA